MMEDDKKNIWFIIFLHISLCVGALQVIVWIYNILFYCCRFRQNLWAKYGGRKEAYAVVTGGSDGIGLELCN